MIAIDFQQKLLSLLCKRMQIKVECFAYSFNAQSTDTHNASAISTPLKAQT